MTIHADTAYCGPTFILLATQSCVWLDDLGIIYYPKAYLHGGGKERVVWSKPERI